MRKYFLFILILVLSLLTAYASWEQFQNDELNAGEANGTGYFNERAIKSVNDSLNGMDFQPLVSDVDNSGKNEIIVFSGNYLKLFDNKLNLVNERFVGNLLGQPTIYNIDDDNFKEIIFISNISSVDYFFAYQYDDRFNQEFNFTVSNGGIGSGIKCTAIGSTNVCVFMDNSQYVHIVNLTSKTDSSYNTSVYTDTQEKVPVIGDLRGNGSLQAVFWFDENNNDDYGLLVFDLTNRNLDSNFNNGIVDDIVQPLSTSFNLKGHPVLVDLNNDNKLEIAISAFYDDSTNSEMNRDSYTELFVYNSTGSKLFSKCEDNTVLDNKCNDGSSEISQWEGTNPFILDVDNNGIDDICFTKDKKLLGNFKNMTINCYNYSGSKILDSEITPSSDTIKTATLADMNNDGILDIITENNIYHKNGSSFYANSLDSNFVIPVDIDGNGGLDLLFSKKSLTQIFIDDFGIVGIKNVSINPLIISSEDSLSCSFVIEGNGDLKANVSWYKNGILQSTETNIECLNGTQCTVVNPILNNSTSKNELWKCSVTAFNESFKSYTRNDEAKILGKASEWAGYCNDKNNLCLQSGTSYFSNAGTTSINNSEGMEFEPLVADVNNDGKNEIIIFSNSKLIIYNDSLGLINEKDIGTLVGQPTIFNSDNDNNLEIIFNTNLSSGSYLMAYEYSNNLTKQCNVTISNGLSGAGIKCADIGNTKSCFFKDQKNVFYNFNMSSCTQKASLATNNNEDTKPTVPSILDYDNDNKLEGLWWFNNDSDNFMGIAVVELETMSFDTNFNNIGFIDDITQGSGIDYRAGFEHLKANPVFYQNDNGGGYEILVSYDNEKIAGMIGDEFQCFRSVIKSYDTDGTLLWAKRPTTCEQSSTGTYNCDISTPVIVDADKDNYEDICFIMKGDSVCYQNAPDDYFYCLNRFGNNVYGYPKNTSDVNLYGGYSTSIDTPLYVADMDNDNELEMIGSGFIWDLNGSVLKGNYSSFTKYAPIPVDVDKNGVLELIGSKVNETDVFYANANICSGKVQVISIDSKNNEVPYTNFYANSVLKSSTDANGLFEAQVSNICGETITYTLKCSNNSIICGTQTGSMDFNNDFDSLTFDCTVCTGNSDLIISSNNINISKENNKVTVNITIENVVADGINLTIKAQDKDTGLISDENSVLFNINSSDKFSVQTVSINLDNADFVHVYVDTNNSINEPKANNYAVVPIVTNKRKAFISVDTGNPYADDAIKNYLSFFVIPTSDADSSLTIAVGLGEHNSIINSKSSFTKDNFKWYVDGNSVYYNNKPIGSRPWIGLAGAFRENTGSDDYVFAIGKEIEGVVAATKRLVNSRNKFFVPQLFNSYTSIIEDTDVLGVSVFDLMHNEENNNKFNNQRNTEFKKAVENILEDNNFEVAIRTVRTVNDNTTLRVKNVNSDFSLDFREAIVGNTTPVVFSGGLFSNLFRWEENNGLAKQLAQEGRNVWEIEMTGGPNTECSTCPNYQYEDLVDYYWPALIAGVEKYSGENIIQYVGHSNGCRVALDSLKNWSSSGKNDAGYYFDTNTGQYLLTDLASSPVDTFVGVGCPGVFNGSSQLITDVNNNPNSVAKLQNKGVLHPNRRDIGRELTLFGRILKEGNSISLNTWSKYNKFIFDSNDNPPGKGLSINKFYLIYGIGGLNGIGNEQDDGMVTANDQNSTANNIQSINNNKLFQYQQTHGSLPEDNSVKKKIKELLKGG